jgi:hypothetical protein
VVKGIFILRNWLSQNSAVGLPDIKDGMADIEVMKNEKCTWHLATSSEHSKRNDKPRLY